MPEVQLNQKIESKKISNTFNSTQQSQQEKIFIKSLKISIQQSFSIIIDKNLHKQEQFIQILRKLIYYTFSQPIPQINHKELNYKLNLICIYFSSFLKTFKKQTLKTIQGDKERKPEQDQNDKETDPPQYKIIHQIAKLFVTHFPPINIQNSTDYAKQLYRIKESNEKKVGLSELSCLFEIKKIIESKIYRFPQQGRENDTVKAKSKLAYENLKLNIKHAKSLLKAPTQQRELRQLLIFTSKLSTSSKEKDSNEIEKNKTEIEKDTKQNKQNKSNKQKLENMRVDIHYLRQKQRNYHFIQQLLNTIELKQQQLNYQQFCLVQITINEGLSQ